MKGLIISFAVALLVVTISCSNSSEPEPVTPGRRDYTWKADTIRSTIYNLFTGIWGSSPTDVYITGEGGDTYDRIRHFDGTKWSPLNQIIYPACTVWGAYPNSIWFGGVDATIQYFDGKSLSNFFTYPKQKDESPDISVIAGTAYNNVFAIGSIFYDANGLDQKGLLLHYNGATWKKILETNFRLQFVNIKFRGSEPILLAVKTRTANTSDTILVYSYTNSQLKEEFREETKNCSIVQIGDEVYVRLGNDIFMPNNKNLITIPNSEFTGAVWGRNKKDIFYGLVNGLGHYNGSDFQSVYNFQSGTLLPYSMMIFEKDVFIVFFDMRNFENIILHGKLN